MLLLRGRIGLVGAWLLGVWLLASACGQAGGAAQAQGAPAQPAAQRETSASSDALGRETPRGTVVGFLGAARRGDNATARQYLDIRSATPASDELAHKLFIVLDARLPARLSQISDAPEGSQSNPTAPDEEVVGRIGAAAGDVDVVVRRLTRGSSAPIWLFSQPTLRAVPALYEEVTLGWGERPFIRYLSSTRLGGVRIFEWTALLVGLPIVYLLTGLLNRILRPVIRALWRRFAGPSEALDREGLPTPVRLLILAFAIRWALSSLPVPLLARQIWSNIAALLTIASVVWMLIALNGEFEQYARRRFPRLTTVAAATLVRVLRRIADVIVIFGGLVAVIRLFGVDPTPALAGLGVGGIAVALAAQKTLENVVAGASLIVDQAVRIGDFLKVGDITGTVDHIGLRSTRIRTLDRTVVSVPNSQVASVSLETISARDMFWLHPIVGVRSDTRPAQLRAIVEGIRRLLDDHPAVDDASVRVRFIRVGEFSQDIEVFAYVQAEDWSGFLEIQEQLLFGITDIIEAAGTQLAFRPQTIYSAPQAAPAPPERPQPVARG